MEQQLPDNSPDTESKHRDEGERDLTEDLTPKSNNDGWSLKLLALLFGVALIASGGTILTLTLTYSGEESEEEMFFDFRVLEVTERTLGDGPLLEVTTLPGELASGITLLKREGEGLFFSPGELFSALNMSSKPPYDREETLTALGYYREREEVIPFLLITGQPPERLITDTMEWESDITGDLALLAARERGEFQGFLEGEDNWQELLDEQGPASDNEFAGQHINNAYTRTNGVITYGPAENQHLIITATPRDFQKIADYMHGYIK